MGIIILRYGGLLALFLIVLETAKRSMLFHFELVEIYVAIVAVMFLCLGVWFASRRGEQNKEAAALQVLNKADFSDRELDVLLFLCHGYSNKEIADHLSITTNTVKSHLKNIYSKLEVTNRTQAAAEAKILKIIG
ncbi:MAG: LuxR C-terminal-related transcriptional regulator [Kordiimonas sp.]